MVIASAVCFRFYAREEPRSPHISVYGRGTCSRTGSQRTTPALAGDPLRLIQRLRMAEETAALGITPN